MNQNQLTQKEKLLLQDLKSQEELCIKKYSKYANEVGDNVLKQLFQQLRQHEEQHLNTINQIMTGQTPVQSSGSQQNMQASSQQSGGQPQSWQTQPQGMQAGGQSQSGQSNQNFTPNSNFKSPNANQKDFDLVNDLLSTEKYVSGTYNTAIFEFNNTQIRQTLNHIQKEEQEHGELLYNYLKQNNAYPLQA
ncbi:MAG: spore coat protein [Bacilli bacterium]|jgi:spore coat protein CotF